MRLYVWRGAVPNFGDGLNDLLWPRLLPGMLDATPRDDGTAPLFLGIGSVLDSRHRADRHKIVAGAGFGGYERPAALDGSWEIYWVRGPHTARQLGLPASFGLGDPASLLPLVLPSARQVKTTIGFMPHFESLGRGAWLEAASIAGVSLIDPRGNPDLILDQIARCHTLLSEALHGVIVADALRVPWVALAPVMPIHRAKWLDWADTLDLTIRFQALPTSSPREAIEIACANGCSPVQAGYARIGALVTRPGYLNAAAAALRHAAGSAPQLSEERLLIRAQTRMLSRLQTLRAQGRHL